MSNDVVKAQRAVQQLREEVARFQRLRTANNEIISGMRAGVVPPQQASVIASAYRDPNMEAQAVEHLRTLIGLLRGAGEAPIQVDLANPLPVGIEGGLGVFPVAAAVAATAASVAVAAFSGFRYMTTREERLLEETRGPLASMVHGLSENVWALAALGGVLFAGLVYADRRWLKGGRLGGMPKLLKPAPVKNKGAFQRRSDEADEEEE